MGYEYLVEQMTPTLFTSCNALPREGAGLAWGGPARQPFSYKK